MAVRVIYINKKYDGAWFGFALERVGFFIDLEFLVLVSDLIYF